MSISIRTAVAGILTPVILGLGACSGEKPEAPASAPVQPAVIEPPPEPQPSATDILREAFNRALPIQPAPDDATLRKYLMGDIVAADDPHFARIPDAVASRSGMYARSQALDAFLNMHAAAKEDGVNLVVVSAFRSFADQRRIWNGKWTGDRLVEGGRLPETVPDPETRAYKILEFSSMPSTSRHHWGTDFDFNNLNNSWFETGEGLRIYEWLTANAASFGFCQVYTAKGPSRPSGYEEEKWHWSYRPLAGPLLAAFPELIGGADITGFEGSETASQIDVITNYVGGVSLACQPD